MNGFSDTTKNRANLRHARTAWRTLGALARRDRPLLVQMVVTRRCNLNCGYCNEYDEVSAPVDFNRLCEQIDRIADLGTVVVTLTGGEPLLHPQLDQLIARIVERGMVCTLISNAYPLTEHWVARLNRSGLWLLQVSVDNIEPNDVSQKSWSRIRPKLELLRNHARFKVNVNAVLGSSPPDEARQLIEQIRSLGFYMTVGLMHNDKGQIDSGLIGESLPQFYREMRRLCRKNILHGFGEGWEEQMLAGRDAPFACRAGARYLYVDENGVVSYCSQRRGDPGISLAQYGSTEMKKAFDSPKGCESQCTIACVRRASDFDRWRAQKGAPSLAGAEV